MMSKKNMRENGKAKIRFSGNGADKQLPAVKAMCFELPSQAGGTGAQNNGSTPLFLFPIELLTMIERLLAQCEIHMQT